MVQAVNGHQEVLDKCFSGIISKSQCLTEIVGETAAPFAEEQAEGKFEDEKEEV